MHYDKELYETLLAEAGFARLLQHAFGSEGFAMVSAYRSERTVEENHKLTKRLG